jgi:hypothetical protein
MAIGFFRSIVVNGLLPETIVLMECELYTRDGVKDVVEVVA